MPVMLASLTRREVDGEVPVVWPAWCYTGDSSGGGSRLCARDATSPAQMLPPAPAPPTTTAPPATTAVKNERSSPNDSNTSRSGSVTPSTSSYPSTTPERVSPLAPPTAVAPPRHYSDIMRTLAARYNTNPSNDYYHRMNGFSLERPIPPQVDVSNAPVGGLFMKLAMQQGGSSQIPAFPTSFDMSSTKTLLALSRLSRGGRSRRQRLKRNMTDHCPLDLSTAGDIASKRGRFSSSPSTRSEGDEKERMLNGEPSGMQCMCAEARARLSSMSVDDVCDFVGSIDICAEYVPNFREQRIDGSGLPLLTEEHLTGMLQMKLGPALKLKAAVSSRLGPCVLCQANTVNNTLKINGTSFKPEPRSNTTSPS